MVAGLLLASGCGSSKQHEIEIRGAACVRPSTRVRPPATFPNRFPLPASAVLTRTRREAGSTVVEGYVPATSLSHLRDELRVVLPVNGFRLGQGDAEEHEAETDFSGHGYEGHLKLRDDVCSGAVTFGVAVRGGR